MSAYHEWAVRHPQAARDLERTLGAIPWPVSEAGNSETYVQQQIRLKWARMSVSDKHGAVFRGVSWRNNVGATPARCPACGAKQQPVRYGLANDSSKLNATVKSHDVIGIVPRLIKPEDVGEVIGQFGSVEAKKQGWCYTGKGREAGQTLWGTVVMRAGGVATFSTGDLDL